MPRLTAKFVEAASSPDGMRTEFPDATLPGFYLVVQPSGIKSWAVRYRYQRRPRKFTLGRYPVLSLAEAREQAREVMQAVDMGKDPSAERRSEAIDPNRDLIRVLIEQFDQRHLSGLRSRKEARRLLDAYVVALWGDRNVHTIERRDVIALIDGIADQGKGTTANRVLAWTRKFFNWCVERSILDTSPALGIKPAAREVARDRVLSEDEIRWLWAACDEIGLPFGPLARLLLLTGQRLGEVAGMRISELDGASWVISGDRAKNGKAHSVPLSKAAMEEIDRMHAVAKTSLLFTTNGTTPVSGFSKAKARLDKAMSRLAAEELGEARDIPHWTLHDLRRTAATGVARLGHPVHVVEAVLNHSSGSVSGVAAVYNRYSYEAEKRNALEDWAHEIERTRSRARGN